MRIWLLEAFNPTVFWLTHSFATETNPLIFPVIFGIYLLLNLFRALRFRLLLDQKNLPLKVLFPIALYHNFWVRTLPFFAGEFSYIALLRRYLKQPISSGLSSLLFSRLFELLLVLLGGSIGFWAHQQYERRYLDSWLMIRDKHKTLPFASSGR